MRKDKIEEFKIPIEEVPNIKAGGDYLLPNGKLISHVELTKPAQLARSFAFCSDTSYNENIIPQIKGVDMLYHEATFLDELKEIIYIQLLASKTELRFPLFFHEFGFDEPELLMENNDLTVHTIPLSHSLPCCGFLFKEKINNVV